MLHFARRRTARRRFQIAALLGCALMALGLWPAASWAHGFSVMSLSQVEIRPQHTFLEVRLSGGANDLLDVIHANSPEQASQAELAPDARQRAARYLSRHLILTQRARLEPELVSLRILRSGSAGSASARFEMSLHYARDPALAVAPLQVSTTLFGYLRAPYLRVVLGGQERVLISGQGEALASTWFAPEATIVTPLENGRRFWLPGLLEFWSGPWHAAFVLALLLACVGMAWRARLAVLASLGLAYGLMLWLGSLRGLTMPPSWASIGFACCIVYAGAEAVMSSRLAQTQREKRRGVRLVSCGAVGGLIQGFVGAASVRALGLPPEGAAVCLAAFAAGVAVSVAAVCLLVLPAMYFGRVRLASEAPSPARAGKYLWPRTISMASSLLLGVAAILTLASAAGVGNRPRSSAPKTVPAQAKPRSQAAVISAPSSAALLDLATVHAPFTRIRFASAPRNPVAGQPVQWTLNVRYREENEPVSDFAIVHAKKLHLIVASSDLSWFTHIHPVLQGNGVFKIHTLLPRAGRYRFYADYTPLGLRDHEVALHEFSVAGAHALPKMPALVPDALRGAWLRRRVVAAPEGQPDARGGPSYQVALMPMPRVVRAGAPIMLHYEVRDGSGKPLRDLQPYMGALGHSVILGADAKTYLHVHPMMGAMNMGMTLGEMLAMPMHDKPLPSGFRGGPEIMFHTFFPRAGIYKVWAQFQHEGRIITAPFVLKVLEPKSGA